MPTTQTEERIEAVISRKAHFQHEQLAAWRSQNGVRFSGWELPKPLELSDDEIRAQAETEISAQDAFRASPRGKLLAALRELEELGAPEAEDLISLYNRSISNDLAPLNLQAVGQMMAVLNDKVLGPCARDAMGALADLLVQADAFRMAAE